MHKLVGVTELQRRFQAIFDEVAHQHVPYILARDSRPEAALIPYHDFVRWQKFQEQEVLAGFDRLVGRMVARNVAHSDEEVAEDVAAARAEVALDTMRGGTEGAR